MSGERPGREAARAAHYRSLGLTRQECIQITVHLSAAEYMKHKVALDKMLKRELHVEGDDKVKVDYTFAAEYFGQVEENLRTLLHLATSGVLLEANVAELKDGVVLIEQTLNALRALEKRLS